MGSTRIDQLEEVRRRIDRLQARAEVAVNGRNPRIRRQQVFARRALEATARK